MCNVILVQVAGGSKAPGKRFSGSKGLVPRTKGHQSGTRSAKSLTTTGGCVQRLRILPVTDAGTAPARPRAGTPGADNNEASRRFWLQSHNSPSLPPAMSSADTSNCVASIISSFANGLDIFKRLRERRRKKKTKKVHTQPDPKSGNELKFSNSLRRGPAEIQTHYERNYGAAGERFAKGDGERSSTKISE